MSDDSVETVGKPRGGALKYIYFLLLECCLLARVSVAATTCTHLIKSRLQMKLT